MEGAMPHAIHTKYCYASGTIHRPPDGCRRDCNDVIVAVATREEAELLVDLLDDRSRPYWLRNGEMGTPLHKIVMSRAPARPLREAITALGLRVPCELDHAEGE
jgi:hypothetical protein